MIKLILLWWFTCSFISLATDLINLGLDCPNVFLTILSGPIGLIKRIIF